MIHIDDLVRQRLSGGEEQDRPGAWLSMRELLDKEMPVSAGYNWRRIIGYCSALLLLLTATVGGIRLYNNYMGPTQFASGGGRNGDDGDGANVSSSISAPVHESSNNSSSNPATLNNPVHSKPYSAPSTSEPATTSASVASIEQNTQTQTRFPIDNGAHSDYRMTRGKRHSGTFAKAAIAQGSQSSSVSMVMKDHIAGQAANNAAQNKKAISQGNKETGLVSAGTSKSLPRSSQPNPVDLAAGTKMPSSGSSSNNASDLGRPEIAFIRHDSIERLEIVYRRLYDAGNERFYYRVDTVSVGKFARNIIIPAPEKNTVASTDAPGKSRKRLGLFNRKARETKDPMLAMASPVDASSNPKSDLGLKSDAPVPNSTISPNANSKQQDASNLLASGASNAKRFRLLDMDKVQMAIDRVKTDIARIQMYPGVMMGINASMFTPNALGGFQLGLTSLFVLNDWWSLMLEPKYIIRFNTGSSIRDDYKQVIDNSGQIRPDPQYPGYYYYTWTDRTIQHSFNYDIVRTFEIPVMLRHNWGQWYMQGGANLAFSSPIKVKEVTQPLNDYKSHGESRPGTTPDDHFITNDHPTVTASDFGSRFGLGYVGSMGYMFSPAVCVDLRLAQTVWDNSKAGGAKAVSKDLLRTPSIQISVGYRFGQKH